MVSFRDKVSVGFVHYSKLDTLKAMAGWPEAKQMPMPWSGSLRKLAQVFGLPVETVVEVFGFTGVEGIEDDLDVEVSLPPKKATDELRQKPVAPWRNELARAISPETYHDLKRR